MTGADFVIAPRVATRYAVADEDTAEVDTVNVADVAPAETVTDTGIVALGLAVERPTTTPPAPACPLSVTVPVEETPPGTVVGLRLTDTSVGGVTVRVVVFETVPFLAVRVAACWVVTPVVFTVNVAPL